MTLLLVVILVAADLASVKMEPDPEKRSQKALVNAAQDVDTAREAYKAGDLGKMRQSLTDLRDSVDLCYESLTETHQKPRRSKYYKRAELKTRALLRRLASLDDEVDFVNRKPVEGVRQRVQEIHDKVLVEIMSK